MIDLPIVISWYHVIAYICIAIAAGAIVRANIDNNDDPEASIRSAGAGLMWPFLFGLFLIALPFVAIDWLGRRIKKDLDENSK